VRRVKKDDPRTHSTNGQIQIQYKNKHILIYFIYIVNMNKILTKVGAAGIK